MAYTDDGFKKKNSRPLNSRLFTSNLANLNENVRVLVIPVMANCQHYKKSSDLLGVTVRHCMLSSYLKKRINSTVDRGGWKTLQNSLHGSIHNRVRKVRVAMTTTILFPSFIFRSQNNHLIIGELGLVILQ